jgi:hypothetical protein
MRWKQTTSITAKSVFLGYLETGSGEESPWLSNFRDGFFTFAGKVGLDKYIYVDGATPKPTVGTEGATRNIPLSERIEKIRLFFEALNNPSKFMDDE